MAEEAVAALREALGDNLYSCCLYGSAIRGNIIEGVSDLNLLIILNNSDSEAHEAIAGAIENNESIDPFVLGRRGFERSVRAFAPKFASIKRTYKVLYGADPLAGVELDPGLERFLCEQALRNLRLRLVHAFVTRAQSKSYDRFLARSVTPLFLRLSEVARLNGEGLPATFEDRINLFAKEFKIDGNILHDLLALKRSAQRLTDKEAVEWHQRVFPILDAAIAWIENNWQVTQFSSSE